MKIRYTGIFKYLAIFILVASLAVLANLPIPSPTAADWDICKWSTVDTPGSYITRNDILIGSEIDTLAVGPTGSSMLATVTKTTAVPRIQLYSTGDSGRSWGGAGLLKDMIQQWGAAANTWDAAIAPDDSRFWAAVTSLPGGPDAPVEVWVTEDAGRNWNLTGLAPLLVPGGKTIRAIDISPKSAGVHDIAVATVDGAGGGDIYVIKSTGFGSWRAQGITAILPLTAGCADYYAVKFSPTYAGDSSLAFVFATDDTPADINLRQATFYNVAFRDIDTNTTLGLAFSPGIELRDPTWAITHSPGIQTLNRADLELPSDFSGQAASLRRAYVSTDAYAGGGVKTNHRDGIFRIDDTTVYTLMDTSNVVDKSIYSIAYFGTYASGKLLAGERMGFPCTATVPTWFTDSPTTCPIPCWYPALKPTTGAAGVTCSDEQVGIGAALVGWGGYGRSDGTLAYAATGSHTTAALGTWYLPWLLAPIPNDESAFAISRNNGETWNQVSLIDTTITKFTDIAPTPDCKTIYLASVNTNTLCAGFDSVWRTSSNADVVSPLAAFPVGQYWERVLTRVTAPTCTDTNTDKALLRIVPYCADPSGQIVAWGVYDPAQTFSHGIAAWSPDYGDYWANITVRDPIQDFTFESQTVMYFLSPLGQVQKMPYTGTAWATALPSVDTIIYGAHSIAAFPEGKVLVGSNAAYHMVLYAVSYSLNFNTDNPSFTVQSTAGRTPFYGDVHVAFDTNFSDTNIYFMNDENYTLYGGSVYRNNPQAQVRLVDADMLDAANGAVGCFTYGLPQTGLVLGFTGGALYSSTAGTEGTPAPAAENLVAVVTSALNFVGAANLTVATTAAPAGNVLFTFPPGPANRAVGAITAGVGPAACDVLSPIVGSAGGGTVQIVGATTGTIYATINLATGAMIEGADTCGTAVSGESSGVLRTIPADAKGNFGPLSGMPKPGIAWDNLTVGLERAPLSVKFTLQPTALKACGCCTLDSDTTLYAIDNNTYVPGTAGLLWAFTDCMAKRGPALVTEDKTLIGCDPVSGRAQEVNLCWEQLCVANAYDIEIGKDADFTIKIIDWVTENQCTGFLDPADLQTPCAYFPAGGEAFTMGSSIAAWGNLECGHTYYWRIKVRECATQQVIRSPWSEVRSFTVKAGLPVVSTYLGLTLLAPNNGCLGCPVQPVSFSWSPFKETTKYKFQLASDAGMTQLVKQAEVVNSSAYEFDGALDFSTNYFWRVMSMEPAPSDWSATFSFQTEAKPVPPPTTPEEQKIPIWAWAVIAIGTILVTVTLVLIFKMRRV